jgi:hypothetical protein
MRRDSRVGEQRQPILVGSTSLLRPRATSRDDDARGHNTAIAAHANELFLALTGRKQPLFSLQQRRRAEGSASSGGAC